MNKFGQTKINEVKKNEEQKEEKKMDTKPTIEHTPNVLITSGSYKGYYGWVKEKLPKVYYVKLDEKKYDTKGQTKLINDFNEYRQFINEQRTLTKYNHVYKDTRNRGISFIRDDYSVFDKNSIENFDEEKYKTWNWNVRGNYFDKKLSESEKERKKELEFIGVNFDNLNIDDNTIENEVLVSIKESEFQLSDVKIIILHEDTLYEFIKITEDNKLLVRQYDIEINKDTIEQKNKEFNEILINNEKTIIAIKNKIDQLQKQIVEYNKERADVYKNIQSYDKRELQKRMNVLESETDKRNDKEIEYIQELLNIDKISQEELVVLNNKYTELNNILHESELKLTNLNKDLVDIKIPLYDTNSEDYLLTNLSARFKEKRIPYKDTPVQLDISDRYKLFSMVNTDVKLGLFDNLKLIDIYYSNESKIAKVTDNMIKGVVKKIGSSVEITKGLYRNKNGVITEITPSKLYVYIDAINREVFSHIKNNKEDFISDKDVIYLDVLDKSNVYYQIISISNPEVIDLSKLPESGIISPESYNLRFKAKSINGISELDVSNIIRFNEGFQIRYKIKRKNKLNQTIEVNPDEEQQEEEEIVQEINEDDNDSNAEIGDYGDNENDNEDELEEEIREPEQEYKSSFKDVEQSSILHEKMSSSHKTIFDMIQKLNKVEPMTVDEYKYIPEIELLINHLEKTHTDLKISKKEIAYIVFLVIVSHEHISDNKLLDKLISKKYFDKSHVKNNFFIKGTKTNSLSEKDIFTSILKNAVKLMGLSVNIDKVFSGELSNENTLTKVNEPSRKLSIIDYIFNQEIIQDYKKKCINNINKISDISNKNTIQLIQNNIWNLPLYLHKIKQYKNPDVLKEVLGDYLSNDDNKNITLLKMLLVKVKQFIDKMNNDIINQEFEQYIKIIEYGDYFYIVEKHRKDLANRLNSVPEYRELYNNFTRLPFYIRDIPTDSDVYTTAKEYLYKIINDISISKTIQLDKKRKRQLADEELETPELEQRKYKPIKLKSYTNNDITNPLIESIKYSMKLNENDISAYLNKGTYGFEPITYALIHSTPDIINQLLNNDYIYISPSTLMIALESLTKDSIKSKVKTELSRRLLEELPGMKDTRISETDNENYKLLTELLNNGFNTTTTIDSDLVKHYREVYNKMIVEYTKEMINIVSSLIDRKPENVNTIQNGYTPLVYAIKYCPMEIIKKILNITNQYFKTIETKEKIIDLLNETNSQNNYLTKEDFDELRSIIFSDPDSDFDMEIDN